jgi:serine/threonine protein kinase
MIGTKLAHYEFVGHLGSGGMGTVWRARDTKLGREVAIKALPADVARDAESLARLQREARLLATRFLLFLTVPQRWLPS